MVYKTLDKTSDWKSYSLTRILATKKCSINVLTNTIFFFRNFAYLVRNGVTGALYAIFTVQNIMVVFCGTSDCWLAFTLQFMVQKNAFKTRYTSPVVSFCILISIFFFHLTFFTKTNYTNTKWNKIPTPHLAHCSISYYNFTKSLFLGKLSMSEHAGISTIKWSVHIGQLDSVPTWVPLRVLGKIEMLSKVPFQNLFFIVLMSWEKR